VREAETIGDLGGVTVLREEALDLFEEFIDVDGRQPLDSFASRCLPSSSWRLRRRAGLTLLSQVLASA
jgi:hypothetical protein